MASLAQIAGAPRIVGEFELSVTLRPNGNGGQLVSPIHDLVAYLRERELIHSAGPNDMRRLVLAWDDADEAPAGCCLKLREI